MLEPGAAELRPGHAFGPGTGRHRCSCFYTLPMCIASAAKTKASRSIPVNDTPRQPMTDLGNYPHAPITPVTLPSSNPAKKYWVVSRGFEEG